MHSSGTSISAWVRKRFWIVSNSFCCFADVMTGTPLIIITFSRLSSNGTAYLASMSE